jgi:uncharacterized membrane protein
MATQHTARRRRIFKIVLAASLALNLLLLGVFAGAALRHGGKGLPAGPRMHSYAVPYVQALPRADRRAIFQEIRKQHGGFDKQARRELYQDMLAGLRADPFDPAAVEAVLNTQSEAVQGAQTSSQTAWLAQVLKMSQAERLEYADAVEEALKNRRERRGRKKRAQD